MKMALPDIYAWTNSGITGSGAATVMNPVATMKTKGSRSNKDERFCSTMALSPFGYV
jgi:hypothetical protein